MARAKGGYDSCRAEALDRLGWEGDGVGYLDYWAGLGDWVKIAADLGEGRGKCWGCGGEG